MSKNAEFHADFESVEKVLKNDFESVEKVLKKCTNKKLLAKT